MNVVDWFGIVCCIVTCNLVLSSCFLLCAGCIQFGAHPPYSVAWCCVCLVFVPCFVPDDIVLVQVMVAYMSCTFMHRFVQIWLHVLCGYGVYALQHVISLD